MRSSAARGRTGIRPPVRRRKCGHSEQDRADLAFRPIRAHPAFRARMRGRRGRVDGGSDELSIGARRDGQTTNCFAIHAPVSDAIARRAGAEVAVDASAQREWQAISLLYRRNGGRRLSTIPAIAARDLDAMHDIMSKIKLFGHFRNRPNSPGWAGPASRTKVIRSFAWGLDHRVTGRRGSAPSKSG